MDTTQTILDLLSRILFIHEKQKESVQTRLPSMSEAKKKELIKVLQNGYKNQEKVLPALLQKNPDLFLKIKQAISESLKKNLREKEQKNKTEEKNTLNTLESEIENIF